jgi:2-keto-4-pentenoate hydratase/2-oxohepta-3-ene-1,7-dioic acid hydratase in catechol pathway
MKLVRYGAPGREKPGMIDAKGGIRDLSKIVPDIAGDVLSPKGLAKLRKLNPDKLPLVKGKPRIGPCVAKTGNFIAIGLNYSDHAAEPERTDHLQQGGVLHLRPERRHHDAEGLDQARLGD